MHYKLFIFTQKNENENKQVNIFLPAEAIQSRLRDMGHI